MGMHKLPIKYIKTVSPNALNLTHVTCYLHRNLASSEYAFDILYLGYGKQRKLYN